MRLGNTRGFTNALGSMPFFGTALIQPDLRKVYEADSEPKLRAAFRKARFSILGLELIHIDLTRVAIRELAVDLVRAAQDPAVQPIAEAMFDAAFGFTNASLVVAEAILLQRLTDRVKRNIAAGEFKPRKIGLRKISAAKGFVVTFGALAILDTTKDYKIPDESVPTPPITTKPESKKETSPPLLNPQGPSSSPRPAGLSALHVPRAQDMAAR